MLSFACFYFQDKREMSNYLIQERKKPETQNKIITTMEERQG